MRERQLDAVLITSGVNIRYISGFTSSDGFVLVTEKALVLFTDFRYVIQAKEQLFEGFSMTEITAANQYELLGEALKAEGVQALGFEENIMPFAVHAKVAPQVETLAPFSDELDKLRLIKTLSEVESLQKAQAIADAGYAALLKRVKPGMTEREVAAELQYLCGRLGSEGPSFETIIGSGPNGAMCHAVLSDRKLTSGDMVVVDFGCMVNGYCSDMTRTFGIGKIDAELMKIYNIVLAAQARALNGLSAGISCKELDALARDYIAGEGYGEHFGHSLGHGFGLEVHEAPTASFRSEETLKSGMTVTIEPGIYLEGKGGVRIEDCCVLTETGHINLVSSPKDLVII